MIGGRNYVQTNGAQAGSPAGNKSAFNGIGNNPWAMGAFGGIGTGLASMFGGGFKNPSSAASPFLDQAQSQLPAYFQPYIDAGNKQIPGLEKGYGDMMDPNAFLKNIGSGYQASPGYEWQKSQGLSGVENAAAAGGMLGSPQHQQQAATLTTGLANQDFYNYLQQALGVYGQGLQGKQGLYDTGAQSSIGLGQDLSSISGSQAQLAYEGQNTENQHDQGGLGSIFGGAASLLPFFLGG